MAARRDRSAYFRAYYLAHREAILAKNREWLDAHKAHLAERRRRRWAADPEYRARLLANNRRAYQRKRAKAVAALHCGE